MTAEEQYQSIRPSKYQRIYDIALQAGLNGDAWKISRKTGKSIDPSDNIYQNSLWTFGGGDEPYLACIWWEDMEVADGRVIYKGNSRENADLWGNLRTDLRAEGKTERRLAGKIRKALEFSSLISTAYFRLKPVRVAVLGGKRTRVEDAADDSSNAELRYLDPSSWWVHSYDSSGAYELVRGIEPPLRTVKDPFDEAPEPGTESDFLDWLENSPLTETEKDAIVKVRVGQGYFRDALIERWKGCAVTGCRDASLLIASHIKPWRHCTTRAERLSPDNGLLLIPNLDKAFDRGLISFDDSFKMLLHPNLHLQARNTLRSSLALRSLTGRTPE